MRLLVDGGLGCVDVLGGQAVVVVEAAGAEAQDGAARVLDGPDDAALEVVPAAVLADEAGADELVVAEPRPRQVAVQRPAVLGGVAHAEPLGGGAVEAAPVEHAAGLDGLGGGELGGEEVGGHLVGLHDAHPLSGRRRRAAVVDDAQLHAGPVGQGLDGLAEREVVDLLHEGDDVAALAAAEAVEQAARRRHLEARGLLVVERAQALERAAAGVAQRHVRADDLVDPGALPHEGDVLVVDASGHARILCVRPLSPCPRRRRPCAAPRRSPRSRGPWRSRAARRGRGPARRPRRSAGRSRRACRRPGRRG